MKKITLLLLITLSLFSCNSNKKTPKEKLHVVTTTSMITDILHNIGGDLIQVDGLMGTGVDPHLYKATEGDVSKLINADIIFYNGLHLEGKLVAIFEKMKHQQIKTVALANILQKEALIDSDYFASNYDPHVWFDINNWKEVVQYATQELKKADPKNADAFEKNKDIYLKKLTLLATEIKQIINTLPQEKRVLVTAHDAFSYFGKAYDFEVIGLQGISTATEAGVQDVQRLANLIIEKKVKAIFVESSVPKRTIEALQAAVTSKNHEVTIGGTLYSDALGNPDTKEGTYTGMFLYNVNTIVNSLQ
ncbi:zinc ABC transporter solute-binding protein [Aquimarina sp. TRL1]|uniref:metal ABC transporter solute-binding protein, Zn/Mn family n=1 Tax=Aquimarina sp. (strain TRL1) TaxID=2736252 RepID=UPI0015886F2E|nr:zinc ABC transporter substrate-binding protein [Aquimarina sp. TRL1]QKX05943.1 zinc ABC transporter solute-binding protein [Aquimarina sp. TRL1]